MIFNRGKKADKAAAIKRGMQAEKLATDPAFNLAFELIEQQIMSSIVNSNWMQYFFRQAAYNRLKALTLVKGALLSEISNGKLEQKRLDK